MKDFKERNESLTKIINSNKTRTSFVKVLADLKIPKKVLKRFPKKIKFSLTHFDENRHMINQYYPENVEKKKKFN